MTPKIREDEKMDFIHDYLSQGTDTATAQCIARLAFWHFGETDPEFVELFDFSASYCRPVLAHARDLHDTRNRDDVYQVYNEVVGAGLDPAKALWRGKSVEDHYKCEFGFVRR